MGFSDLGCYGSEIDTPNIDQLAGKGLRFMNLHNTARCCPTRAPLLQACFIPLGTSDLGGRVVAPSTQHCKLDPLRNELQ
jgi:Sulfatase